jgi:hypothetical protein
MVCLSTEFELLMSVECYWGGSKLRLGFLHKKQTKREMPVTSRHIFPPLLFCHDDARRALTTIFDWIRFCNTPISTTNSSAEKRRQLRSECIG